MNDNVPISLTESGLAVASLLAELDKVSNELDAMIKAYEGMKTQRDAALAQRDAARLDVGYLRQALKETVEERVAQEARLAELTL